MIARPVSAIKRNKKTPQIAAARQVRIISNLWIALIILSISSYSKKN